MMKRLLCMIAVAAILLCLLVGCHKPAPPTLTPTFETMRVNIENRSVTKDENIRTDFHQIYLEDEPHKTEITDHRGDKIEFVMETGDPQTQTAVIRTSKPLILDGQETSVITVGHEKVCVYVYGENGAGDEIVLWITPYTVNDFFVSHMDVEKAVTMCYGEGMLLTMYSSVSWLKPWFKLTFADDPTREIGGTYAIEDDVLTLQEYGGLSVITLRRDDRLKGWRVDADASAYHPQAQMPVLADRTLLNFGFAYEISDNYYGDFVYRVTDFDGNTLLSGKDKDTHVAIYPLSPTMLRLHIYKTGIGDKGRYHYLNTATGEYSTGYTDVYAQTATQAVYVKDDALIVQELGGEYASHSLSFDLLGAQEIGSVLPEGDTVTVFYRDAQKNFRVGTWDINTYLPVASDPLAITGYTTLDDSESFVLSEDKTSFMPNTDIRQVGVLKDNTLLYTVGVKHAALRIGDKYVELTHQDWHIEGDKIDNLDFVNPPVTAEELTAQLKADAAAGLATAETCLDGKATVYHYNGENRFHTVTVAQTVKGCCVYIGDAETALADAAIGLEFVK